MSKVRDWLTPVLWGTPKARLEEDEELGGENNETETDISEQLQMVRLQRTWLLVMASIIERPSFRPMDSQLFAVVPQ